MLILTSLNETIAKAQEEQQLRLLEKFSFFREQVEEGVKNIAAQGKRMGELTIITNSHLKTYDIEKLLTEHYQPISFVVSHNQTHSEPSKRIKSYFIVEVVIPSVREDDVYGYEISK